MQSSSNIYIFSAPVQSGKTTLLLNWIKHQKNVRGILAPDIGGTRKIYNIKRKSYHEFQTSSSEREKAISIGKFHFYQKGFNYAKKVLIQSLKQNPEWLIVDEVGKLELHQQKGLEPAVTHLIDYYKNKKATGKLLLIIRDTLLNECIEHYGLQEAIIVNKDFFSTNKKNDLYGLVVCGGKSTRMGVDKCLLNYHGKPQAYHLYEMMQPYCDKVFISCNSAQVSKLDAAYPTIVDDSEYENIGPMAALLSAFEKYPDKSFLVIGCDYPFIGAEEIQALIGSRDNNAFAVCYQNNQLIAEPLLALYERETFSSLKNNFSQQKYSLRYFLDEVNAKEIFTKGDDILKSVDTTGDFEAAFKKINL